MATSPWPTLLSLLTGDAHFSPPVPIFASRKLGCVVGRADLSWMSLKILFVWHSLLRRRPLFLRVLLLSALIHGLSLLGELCFLGYICTYVFVEAKYIMTFQVSGEKL